MSDLLDQTSLDAVLAEALAVLAGAADLSALAACKPATVGDRSALARARQAVGALPKDRKAEAGKRVNAVAQTLGRAFEERRLALEAERDARVLVEEAVDVTVLPGALPRGRGTR